MTSYRALARAPDFFWQNLLGDRVMTSVDNRDAGLVSKKDVGSQGITADVEL